VVRRRRKKNRREREEKHLCDNYHVLSRAQGRAKVTPFLYYQQKSGSQWAREGLSACRGFLHWLQTCYSCSLFRSKAWILHHGDALALLLGGAPQLGTRADSAMHCPLTLQGRREVRHGEQPDSLSLCSLPCCLGAKKEQL